MENDASMTIDDKSPLHVRPKPPIFLKSAPMLAGKTGGNAMRNPGAHMALCWTELAASPQWRLDKLHPVLHVVEGVHHSCTAIAVNKRWLCGSGGSLTLFTTPGAAVRFLQMLHLPNPKHGGKRYVETVASAAYQCFRLEGNGLTLCERCPSIPSRGNCGAIASDEDSPTEGEY